MLCRPETAVQAIFPAKTRYDLTSRGIVTRFLGTGEGGSILFTFLWLGMGKPQCVFHWVGVESLVDREALVCFFFDCMAHFGRGEGGGYVSVRYFSFSVKVATFSTECWSPNVVVVFQGTRG